MDLSPPGPDVVVRRAFGDRHEGGSAVLRPDHGQRTAVEVAEHSPSGLGGVVEAFVVHVLDGVAGAVVPVVVPAHLAARSASDRTRPCSPPGRRTCRSSPRPGTRIPHRDPRPSRRDGSRRWTPRTCQECSSPRPRRPACTFPGGISEPCFDCSSTFSRMAMRSVVSSEAATEADIDSGTDSDSDIDPEGDSPCPGPPNGCAVAAVVVPEVRDHPAGADRHHEDRDGSGGRSREPPTPTGTSLGRPVRRSGGRFRTEHVVDLDGARVRHVGAAAQLGQQRARRCVVLGSELGAEGGDDRQLPVDRQDFGAVDLLPGRGDIGDRDGRPRRRACRRRPRGQRAECSGQAGDGGAVLEDRSGSSWSARCAGRPSRGRRCRGRAAGSAPRRSTPTAPPDRTPRSRCKRPRARAGTRHSPRSGSAARPTSAGRR